MIPVSLAELAVILQAELVFPAHQLIDDSLLTNRLLNDRSINQVTTDTRNIAAGSLFVALKGERFDGHHFAEQAVNSGAVALVVSQRLTINIPQLLVKDTRIALGHLGAWVRAQVPALIVALTGSSGKTSVKEMTAAILKQCGNVLYTAGNFNNDIGVPLTLLRLTPEHQFAVIELGANHVGEIAYAVDLVKPQSALVNNLSAAHLEGFGSLAGVAQAKGEIFAALAKEGLAIINLDSHDWQHWQTRLVDHNIWRFSVKNQPQADFYASDIHLTPTETEFILHSPLGQCKIRLPLLGTHNIANALAASALAISVGASLTAVVDGLAQSCAVPGRLFPIKLRDNQLLLDDTYNANVGSMTAAANVLAAMPGYRVMVVGDMAELGNQASDCHQQVGEILKEVAIDQVLSVGNLSQKISQISGCGQHFATKAALVAHVLALLKQHQTITILIKGSRSAAMEQIIQGIQENLPC